MMITNIVNFMRTIIDIPDLQVKVPLLNESKNSNYFALKS